MIKLKKFFIAVLVFLVPLLANAKVFVFACEPEWKSLAEEIGAEKVKTFSATHAKQDPHHIRARPSLISKARKADMVFCSGAGLEVGWLPLLLNKASSKIQPFSDGYFMASNYVNILEVPKIVDRSMGDIHPQGNPHIHLDPYNIVLVAKEFTKKIILIDPENEGFYKNQLEKFSTSWNDAIKNWEARASILIDKKAVVHHRSFSYLFNWLKINQVGTLEPVPGIPPTASHLESLLKNPNVLESNFILRSPYDPDNASLWLSEKTKAPAILMPYTVDDEGNENLFELYENIVNTLIENLND